MDFGSFESPFSLGHDQDTGSRPQYVDGENAAKARREQNRQAKKNARERARQKRDLGIAVIRKARKVAQMVEMDERNQNSSGAQNRKLDLVNTVLRWVAHPVFDDSIFYQLQDDDTSERSTNEMTEFEGVSASQATFGAVEETNLENIINGSHRQSADVSSGLSSTTLQLGFKCPHPACPSNLGFGDEVSRGAAFATEPGDLPTNTYSSGRLRGGPNLKY